LLEWLVLSISRTFAISENRPSVPERVALLSLSGMPPTLGFVRVVLVAGMLVSGGLIAPAAVVLASQMFIASACAHTVELPLHQPEPSGRRRSPVAVAICALAAGLLLVFALVPGALVGPLL
jgi:formate hydrogenlyase subunit 3/multisubunit Na+/H+ antiporter MnhD subunit